MRKHQQKRILELTQTLNEACAEIERLFSRKNFPAVIRLLADSQEFVSQISGYIDMLAGGSTKTASLLSEYNKTQFNISTELNSAAFFDNGLEFNMREMLSIIENQIKTELKPDKIEMAFFPYNASMWDSLESVWLAAKDDPQCDAYVVPIPYYDRLPNGSFGRMHYEGDKYPDYVPVVDWQEYVVEEHHPDVIFIHYPYDDMGQNASVHPNYYAKNLREYCDLLVYVPYFISATDNVPDYYSKLPGIINADCAIVQSEAVRQSYIRHFAKYDRQNDWNGRYGNPQDKFIALGSPKFDKVLNSQKEDFKIPEEWARLIYKPDGTAKKVILYNTHMFAWIDAGEHYFKKLLSVFNIFRERDDVVLWWRPHPNTEINFRTLRPQMLEEYYRTVEDYKRDGFGIYDDTADVNLAIAFSDAYYGDSGSAVEAVYETTNKPILGQLIFIRDYKKKNVHPGALYAIKNGILFNNYGTNQVFFRDTKTGMLSIIKRLRDDVDGVSVYSRTYYFCATEHNNKIYFSPGNANDIFSYDSLNGKTEYISLKLKNDYRNKYKLRRAYTIGDSIYFVGYFYPAIIQFDPHTKSIIEYDDWVSKVCTQDELRAEKMILYDSCLADKCIAAVSYYSTLAIIFDTTTKKTQTYTIKSDAKGFSNICYDGEFFWISPIGMKYIIRWSPANNSYVEYDKFPEGFDGDKNGMVNGSFCFNDYIYLIPDNTNMILKVNKYDGTIYCVKEFDLSTKIVQFLDFSLCDKKVYLSRLDESALSVLDLITEQYETLEMDLSQLEPSEFELRLREDDSGAYGSFLESGFVNIDSFLDALCKEERGVKAPEQSSNIGEKIYTYIKNLTMDG